MTNTTRKRGWSRLFSAYLALVLLVAVAGPGLTVAAADDPSGAGVVPELYDGNPPVGPGGMKIDPPPSLGVNEYEWVIDETTTAHITVTVYETDMGVELDWTSDVPVTKVVVKGGNVGAYIYHYDPALYADTGLHTPMNPSGKWAGLSHVDFYFGEPPDEPVPGSIKVFKFEDVNENDQLDAGEAMLSGWEFTLYDAEDAQVATGLTGEDGTLVFGELLPGDYVVTETLTGEWVSTTGVTMGVTVVEAAETELWFGNVLRVVEPPETGSVKVYKFEDLNGNGAPDEGEDLLPGWEFTLNDAFGEPVDVGTTGEDGTLVFDSLAPGAYTVIETLTDGWISTTGVDSDVNVAANEMSELWFGNRVRDDGPPLPGSVRVYKYNDANGNGEFDEGESMLPGWEFTLKDAEGLALDSGVTGQDGTLVFDELMPGTYTVTETLKDGWISTTGVTDDAIVLADGQTGVWFGNLLPVVEPPEGLDLAITKLANRETAGPGDLVRYTLTYRNLGDTPATDFTLVDDFDERYVTVTDAAGGVVANGKITWTLAGPLSAADGPKTIEYTVRVNTTMPAGTTNVDNVVTISHPDDTDATNNTDDERVIVTVEPFLPFTGGESLMLVLIALATAAAGLVLRRRGAITI